MASWELAKAFVTLSTQGMSEATRSIEQMASKVNDYNAKQKSLTPILDYAALRGLNTATLDAAKLRDMMQHIGSLPVFDRWIHEQIQLQQKTKETQAQIEKWRDLFPSLQQPAPAIQQKPTQLGPAAQPGPTQQPVPAPAIQQKPTQLGPAAQPGPTQQPVQPVPAIQQQATTPTSLLEALATIEKRLDQVKQKNASLGILSDYAKTRGLKLADDDLANLARKMGQLGSVEAFDKWIDGQKKFRANMDDLNKAIKETMSFAGWAFAAGTASLTGFVIAASPSHWATLQGSIQLVGASIGQAFLPYMEMAIDWIQKLYWWIQELDLTAKESIASWVMWGGAILAVIPIGRMLLWLFAGLGAPIRTVGISLGILVTWLRSTSVAAAASAPAIHGMGTAMTATAAKAGVLQTALTAMVSSTGIGLVLALVGAVVALSGAFGQAGAAGGDLVGQLEQMNQLTQELERGLTRRNLQQAFANALEEQGPGQFNWSGLLARLEGARNRPQQFEQIRQEALAQAQGEVARGTRREQLSANIQEILNRPGVRQGPGPGGGLAREAYRNIVISQGRTAEERSILVDLFRRGQLGQALTPAAIQQILGGLGVDTARARARVAGLERLAAGPSALPADRARMTSPPPFQAQFLGVEQAWQRVQQAAAGKSVMEAEQMRIQMESRDHLANIAQNTAPQPQQQPPQQP